MARRAYGSVVTGILAVLLLTACAPDADADPGPYGGERSGLDVLPPSVDGEGIDPGSVHYLGLSRGGAAFYAVKSADAEGKELFCLVSFIDEMTWSTVCDDELPVTARVGAGRRATLYQEAPAPRASEEAVGEYVILTD